MDMQELTQMFEELLKPLMERLEKLEGEVEEVEEEEAPEPEGETEAEEHYEEEEGETKGEEPVVEEIVEEVVEAIEDEEEDEKKSEMSELAEKIAEMEKASVLAEAKIAELQAELDLRDAKTAVEADIAGKPHLSQMSERLVGLYQKDRDLYTEVLSIAGEAKSDVKSVLSQRVTSGFSEVQKPSDPFAAAHDIASEKGISYREALEGVLTK